ncbi:uncharacterized protein LOC110852231 [Folsomia candida]|uniref:uncharacterized protein LOC110852231 n=1 Tax=Folsomia candida TaxID=158441 RepID=UPI000B8F2D1A|nr:uncharacterized protein LOC110852231 [Folsomia candida]
MSSFFSQWIGISLCVLSVFGQYEDENPPDVDINGVEDGFFHFNPTLAHDDPDDLIFNPRPELPYDDFEDRDYDYYNPTGLSEDVASGSSGTGESEKPVAAGGGSAAGAFLGSFGRGVRKTVYSRQIKV